MQKRAGTTVCLPSPNGSSQQEGATAVGVTNTAAATALAMWHGKGMRMPKPTLWVQRSRTNWEFMICRATYGNGVRTDMAIIAVRHPPTLKDRHRVLTACLAAAAGTTVRGSAGCRAGASSPRATGTTTAASALLCPFSLRCGAYPQSAT